MTSDTDYLAHVLADGEWHSRDEILAQSMRERGCGLTVHSRAADLRKRGVTVLCDTENNTTNRRISFYRIVEARGGHGTQGEPAAPSSSSGVETPAAKDGALSEAQTNPDPVWASLSASIPALPQEPLETHDSRGGALTSHKDREGRESTEVSMSAPPDVSPQPGDARGNAPPVDALVEAPGALTLFDQPRGAYGD